MGVAAVAGGHVQVLDRSGAGGQGPRRRGALSEPPDKTIIRQAIRRGTFRTVKDLIGAITRFIDGWNDRCEPFVWTKTAEQVLNHSKSQTTLFTRH